MNLHPMKEDWSSLSAKLRLPTGCPVEGNILKGYQRLDESFVGIELGQFMGWILCNWTSFSQSHAQQQGPQCLPYSSQSLERNRNILLSHPHLNLHRHLTALAQL